MTHILVTGGAGFIGSHTIKALLKRGDSIICIDNFNNYYDPAIKRRNISTFEKDPNVTIYEGDITDQQFIDEVFEKETIEKVIHLAARAGVRPSLEIAPLYVRVNVEGTTNLLEAARKNNIKNFVYASSSSVYGQCTNAPFTETESIDRPISPYATTKRAAELLCATYNHLYNLPCICLRFFTVFGPHGRPDMAPYIFTKAIIEGTPIKKFGAGDSRRDYTYVDDIVQGVIASVDAELDYEIINLGNQTSYTLNEFISLIEDAIGKKAKIMQEDPKPGDVPLTCASIEKAKKILHYNPQTPLKEGLIKFVGWYKETNNL